MTPAVEYIRNRRDAWAARLRGDIQEAQRLESQPARMLWPTLRVEAACDDLAANPGTVASDWYILEQDWGKP